jgi:tryptophan halogenase
VRRGIIHILDDVDDAVVGEGDIISHLKLRRNGLFPVDLVVDCTGFKGLIISGILKEPFDSYGAHLLCDRAVPLQLPYRPGEDIESCTTATALSAGWVWRIPLFNRVGYGYVYSSAFKSDDEAVRELCRHLRVDPDAMQPRVIRMRVGRVRRAWVGNCIAIGLSGGFIEPLEATAIMASMVTAFLMTRHFPTRAFPEVLRRQFNQRVDYFYDAIRDFITMLYYLANRTEPFWLAARAETVLSEQLRENLDLWRYRLPDPSDIERMPIFNHTSYAVNLAAKRFFRDKNLFYQANVSRAAWDWLAGDVEQKRQKVRAMPSARELLLQIHGQQSWQYGGDALPGGDMSARALGRSAAAPLSTAAAPAP